ncbi:uncharacterized protein LTR77_006243 [Saxophila tyrrhenica]|uniref:Metallo-beta-lactamase domain-containing protein n=1 Tax=Saxophila tyrrhenica TaxID=1690608 RepID=A0AAV9PAD7_9PEZI|nr:hypothetical protein LTR77_006243 [Saxophila tyrrhenica]
MSDSQTKQAPDLGIPASKSCCKVEIIDTTTILTVPDNFLVEPHIEGKDYLNLPDYAFLLTSEKGEKVVFDLGTRHDWWNSVPSIAEMCEKHVPGLRVDKDVTQVLEDGGVKLADLKSLILSHWHFDHNGNLSSLPTSVDLITGPGFKDAFLPGYPAKQESVFWEEDFRERNVIEAPFDMKIGKFDAWDYFSDGSLYVLNVPGHATAHVSALVRTTPDTFVFLGGDVCHFTGDIRPSEYINMPENIPKEGEALLDKRFSRPCPCSIFMASHPSHSDSEPFYRCASGSSSFYVDPPTAQNSIRTLIGFDANPNVCTLIAHDPAPLKVMPFFPNGTINDWKEKDFKRQMHWDFLNEIPAKGVPGKDPLVDGLYRKGKKVRGLEV